jgi:hypothetical protein
LHNLDSPRPISQLFTVDLDTINMFFTKFIVPGAFLITGALAGPLALRDNDSHDRICPNLKVEGGGCIRCE